jgi:hypothetical protein
LRILTNTLELALDCERTWDEYYDLAAPPISGPSSKRLFRINPTIRGVLPALDEVHRMGELRREVQEYLAKAQPRTVEVARQLVASSFYFKLDSVKDGILDKDKVEGTRILTFCPQKYSMYNCTILSLSLRS